jgi:hypothetical protein
MTIVKRGATVIYTHPTLGMGLAFSEVESSFVPTLQKWFLQAMTNPNASEN